MRAHGQHVSGRARGIRFENQSGRRRRPARHRSANPNARITELLENLGALPLLKIIPGPLSFPDDQTTAPEPANPSHEEITRTCLEAHKTLMAVNPDNVARFKDVAQFLAEDLKNVEKGK